MPALRRCGGGSMLGRMPDNDAAAGPGLPGSGYGDVLWEPSPEVVKRARITDYRRWLATRGVGVGAAAAPGVSAGGPAATAVGGPAAAGDGPAAAARDYGQLWRWSVEEPTAFWGSLWDYFGVLGERGHGPVLAGGQMPDASWFPGATLNYARN